MQRIGLIGRLTIAAGIGGLAIGLAGMFAVDRYATQALLERVEELNQGVAARLAFSFDDRILRTVVALKVEALNEDVVSLNRARATPELAAVLRVASEYDVLSLYDRTGKPVASSASRFLADPTTVEPRKDVFDEVREMGFAVSVRRGRISALEIAAPVESPPGTMIGALVAQMPLEGIGGAIASFRLGRTGKASLLDPQGRTLVHQDRGRIVRAQRIDTAQGIDGTSGSSVVSTQDGEELLVSVAPTQIFQGSVAIEQTLADVTQPLAGARRILILIVFLSVLATAGVILIAGRRVLAPIQPLMVAVRDLGSGDRMARAPNPKRSDEIGLLSEQFNRMANALEGFDRAKSEFIANAAHELRTPLTVVSGLSELLTRRDALSPKDLDEVCEGLVRQGARARILVERMLDLLRIESGHVAATRQPLNIATVIQRALDAAPAPDGRTIEIEVDPELAVVADEVALEQVISNLLTNAYRYGGSVITISGAQSGDRVQIMIEDDGDGVSAAAAKHLFEPFNRGTQADGIGSGLGLAIVRKLMASMEGTVRYEERTPNGARFVLELEGQRGSSSRG